MNTVLCAVFVNAFSYEPAINMNRLEIVRFLTQKSNQFYHTDEKVNERERDARESRYILQIS